MNKITFLLCILFFLGCVSISCRKTEKKNSEDILELKKELGRYLFFDKRLSVTETKSCSSCHDPSLAFSDGYRRAPGVFADLHFRNTPSLVNVSHQRYFNWANPEIMSIEKQMDGPLFGKHPVEMGLDSNSNHVLAKLKEDQHYKSLFENAFPEIEIPITWKHLKESLSVFVASINSFDSPYDRYIAGDSSALSESAKAGKLLFFSPKYQCFSCHRPPLFGADSNMTIQEQYANIGLYSYSEVHNIDNGLFQSTQKEEDKGKFRTPSLRNLSLTAPFFHDGSADNLEEVLEVYEAGGRNITFGDHKGDGRNDPNKHQLIKGIKMSPNEKQQLLDFLYSLNDFEISNRKEFQSPFKLSTSTYVQ